jgi:hypothetical protein
MKINEYLDNSLKSDNKDMCRGWKYMEDNISDDLKKIIQRKEYWDLIYLNKMVDYVIKETKATLTEEQKKQLGSFVYVYNGKRREEQKQQKEQEIINQGYIKISSMQKELDGKKVKGIFNVSTIGILGSFDKPTEIEGRLLYDNNRDALILIPKRCRTRGILIRDYAFIKEA